MRNHIYIHFPFCLSKCHYCDFNSYPTDRDAIPFEAYTQALLNELAYRCRLFEEGGLHGFGKQTPIDSIYIGGGTPSLMRPRDVDKLLAAIRKIFTCDTMTEVTIEANPETLNAHTIDGFVRSGINRFSIGIQSLNNKTLKQFRRIHSAEQALAVLELLNRYDGVKTSADLIFGFPGQGVDEWVGELKRVMGLGINHLSCYALSCDRGSSYYEKVKRGELPPPDPDLVGHMLEATYDVAETAGIGAYEISNFAREGFECRHNLGYWRYEPYMGLGAGACGQYYCKEGSSDFLVREVNRYSPDDYMRAVLKGQADADGIFTPEKISRDQAVFEYLMMGLRLREGIAVSDFRSRFGDLLEGYQGEIDHCVHDGLLETDNLAIRPTRKGFIFNNRLVLRMMK
ncbi:MAG: radical SAM family heme chaperone HemW [Deltaproteobacteria bacterium]|nr:radical SAM family heme chaperone HemW [Deltaproteobacteria bacterium]